MKSHTEEEDNKKQGKKDSLLRNLLQWRKVNKQYHFTMAHDENLEPLFSFNLNLMNLAIVTVASVVVLIVVTTLLIAFTPLREYIPGYTDNNLERELYVLGRQVDSLSKEMDKKDIYFNNIKKIVEGYPFENDSTGSIDIYSPLSGMKIDTIQLKKSVQDSLLRAEFESENLYGLYENGSTSLLSSQVKNFFVPLNGIITQPFNADNRHYGIDIAAPSNRVINATLGGTVIYATWNVDSGYSIGIMHSDNYFSSYKHNAQLLKKEGDFVRAGEAIAILGESGDMTTGPHLHFELWHNGTAVDPATLMSFENPK
ncbi:MAG: M23 family metallopeptidase [Candidatus Limimorpha sp.]